jgi:CRP/FNR family transcriptional regulator, dissimilatory nitrate respiration regulator
MVDFSILSLSPVFMGIKPDELKQLLNGIVFQVRNYGKGVVVALTGQEMDSLYILMNGSVSGEMMDYSGKTLKIEDIEAPRPLASAFLFGSTRKFPVTVTANTDVSFIVIPRPDFLVLMQRNQVVLANYLNAISSRAQFLSQKLHFLSFKSIREKIAHFLLQQTGSRLNSFELKITQQQLADLFCVSRPALARVFGEMQKEGLISTDHKTITLLDRERLNILLRQH